MARTEYEKPVVRQGGVIYEHMRDMEIYYSRLHTLHVSVMQVLKNLEAAFECLSRQITISLQSKDLDRAIPNKRDGVEISSKTQVLPEMKGYDSLGTEKKTTESKKGSKIKTWDELG